MMFKFATTLSMTSKHKLTTFGVSWRQFREPTGVRLWVHSLLKWEDSESCYNDHRGDEDVPKVIPYLFADENVRSLAVAYGHVTKFMANVKNDIYRS